MDRQDRRIRTTERRVCAAAAAAGPHGRLVRQMRKKVPEKKDKKKQIEWRWKNEEEQRDPFFWLLVNGSSLVGLFSD